MKNWEKNIISELLDLGNNIDISMCGEINSCIKNIMFYLLDENKND